MRLFAALALLAIGAVPLDALAASPAIPPIVLQVCTRVKPAHFGPTAWLFHGNAKAEDTQPVSFDVSFVNTTTSPATLVLLRIGANDFVKMGTFSPGTAMAWRLKAVPGECSIRAARFADGSEWER